MASAENLFDKSQEYEEMLNAGIRLSGESREWFMVERIRDLKSRLPADFLPRRVLDFGCGIGDSAAYLAEVFPQAEVVGVDTAEEAIAHAQRVHGSDRVRFGGLTDLSEGDDFDLCYTNGVFHHIPLSERMGAANLVYRALAPGGRFALMENNPWNPGARMVMARIEFDRDAVMLWPGETRSLLRSAGFEHVDFTRFLFVFPRLLGALRFMEPWLARFPLGAQYYVLGRKA